MKACTLCGAEYSERISFCFNDGEVLVEAAGGAVGVAEDPFDVPMPGNVPSAMPPTHVARTPVPGERRQRSIVQAQDGQLMPPPAQPEPDDFTPRPLQPLDVDPNEDDGPATPMYTPPAGMFLDDDDAPPPSQPPPPRAAPAA
ncbi:MAG: hypothetical protein EP330_25900, partial [Deltaproteobacteria bacterium]